MFLVLTWKHGIDQQAGRANGNWVISRDVLNLIHLIYYIEPIQNQLTLHKNAI